MISQETLELFNELLSQVNLSVGDENFEKKTEKVIKAKKELKSALEELEESK